MRVYTIEFHKFFKTAFVLKNKEQKTYENIFAGLKSNIISSNKINDFLPKDLY